MAKLSPLKRRFFFALTALLVYLTFEGIAFTYLKFYERSTAKADRSAQSVRTILARYDEASDAKRRMLLHPYVGYVHVGQNLHDQLRRKRPDRVLLGISGGSVAAGFSMDPNGAARLIELLKKDPRYTDKKFEILRLVGGGYYQPQQLLALTYLLSMGGQFDILVNIDGFNEVASAPPGFIERSGHPRFPRNWHRTRLPSEEMLRNLGRLTLLQESVEAKRRLFSSPPLSWSPTARLVWAIIERRDLGKIVKLYRLVQRAPSSVNPDFDNPPYDYTARGRAVINDLANWWALSSRQMNELCNANGIQYFHFLQPNQYLPGSKVLSTEEQATSFSPNSPFREGVVMGYPLLKALGGTLVKQGVRFTDLSMIFKDRSESIYYDDCCHFKSTGNGIMAEAIAKAILASDSTGTKLPG